MICEYFLPICDFYFHCCLVTQFVWLFATPWTAARQASLFFTISQSLFKLMSIESVMPSNHLILYHPLFLLPSIFPSIRSFPMSQLFASGDKVLELQPASVLPMNIQGWYPLGLTGVISLQSKRLSRAFFSTKVQKHRYFDAQLSLWSNSHSFLKRKSFSFWWSQIYQFFFFCRSCF